MSNPAKIETEKACDQAKRSLQRLGFESFIGSQWLCLEPLLEGNDVLALLPTGAGKSAIYQVAALTREGVGLVVSPLIAIMQQQVDLLQSKGIKAEFLNSTQNGAEQNDLHWRLRHKDVEILYMSPEKLLQPSTIGLLEDISIACIAIDEAHCVLRWGDNFRPEYSQLGRLKETFVNVPIIALTGTLLRTKEQVVSKALNLTSPSIIRETIHRPNMRVLVSQKRRAKQQLHSFLLKDGFAQSGIVYCRSRAKTEELANWLTEQGIRSTCYHASLNSYEREQAHQLFALGQVQVLVATTAYGMGVDLEHVRFVVHMDLPLSLESYVQEIGRAGRDGRPATALLFYGLQDVLQTWQFIHMEGSDEQEFWALLRCLEGIGCRQAALLQAFEEMSEANCERCDRCQKEAQHNSTVAAQKLLSLIHHSKGLVPFSSLINTLLGKLNKSVSDFGLQQHSLFGQGKSLTEGQWKTLVRSLLAHQYIALHQVAPFSVALAEKARLLLRGERQLILSADYYYPSLKEQEVQVKTDAGWHHLMQWSVANQAHRHLSDTQLHRIYESKPRTLAALSRLTGLSTEKLLSLNAQLLFDDEVVHDRT